MSTSQIQRRLSRSAALKAKLDYPVIDTDLHTIEFLPELEDYVAKYGGAKIVDEFRAAVGKGFAYLNGEWYDHEEVERRRRRLVRPAWWGLPAENTLDLTTVSIPKLLHERLEEAGTDYAVAFPNVSTFATHIGKEDLRRAVIRAVNHYHADTFRPYADRITPVAAIPLHTPEEGVEELEFAISKLGLKVALIPGNLRRPVESLSTRYPFREHPELARFGTWLDVFGIDSVHDYDPFWAKAVELKTVLTTHSIGMGWTSRSSITNYMYNHIGHFAQASEALAKALFLGGVTRRFPDLRLGFLEGGAAWAAGLYADLVGHWEKRGRDAVKKYDPERLDRALYQRLHAQYASPTVRARLDEVDPGGTIAIANKTRRRLADHELDDFGAAGIERIEDIRDRFVPNFYFGSEADDPTVAYAFNTRVNPLGATLNAFWATDSGHWDTPDLTTVLADTFSLVERGALTAENFRDLVFTHPHRFFSEKNPQFFQGTAVEARLAKNRAA